MNQEKNNQYQAAMLNQQISQLNQHLENLSGQIEELTLLSENLEKLSDIKKEQKSYMPVSGGIYIEGIVLPIEKLLVNVGSNVMVKKSLPDTKKIIESQISQLVGAREKLEKEANKLTLHFQSIKA